VVTLLLIAYAGAGKDGVTAMIEVLQEELARTMSYVGCPTVASIKAGILGGFQPAPSAQPNG
jgi:isopentenyl diphosphate isomerase/L-lactate dehydrogenase-like FMN-dependent dehydrogenase